MANLLSIAEIAARSIFPNPSSAQITLFVEAAKVEYAAAMWIFSKEEEASGGSFEWPSSLLTTVTKDVKDGEIDISDLNVINSLSGDRWLQDIGGFNCDCRYVKTTRNQQKMMCDDDSLGENTRTYVVEGKRILFPEGTHADKLDITYANMGIGLDPEEIECNEYVASRVADKLQQRFGNKFPEDKTVNSNSNT